MTGKQFKEFASQVPDNAVIEIETDSRTYKDEWKRLDPKKIQARFVLKPSAIETVNEQEQVEA